MVLTQVFLKIVQVSGKGCSKLVVVSWVIQMVPYSLCRQEKGNASMLLLLRISKQKFENYSMSLGLKRAAERILSMCIHSWWGAIKKIEPDSAVLSSGGTRKSGHNLKYKTACWNIFSMRRFEHWNVLPTGAVESPYLVILKSQSNWAICVCSPALSSAVGIYHLQLSLPTSIHL